MQPEPGQQPRESFDSSSGMERTRGRATSGDQRMPQDASQLRPERPSRGRLHLQRRAPGNLRHHVVRSLTRLAVLIGADMLTFGLMRALARAVRDQQVLGTAIATWVQVAVPPGPLNGWQYAVALFLGLVVLGNYGQGDERRNPGRLFAACALATALPLWMSLWTRGVGPVLWQYSATTVLVWLGLVTERLTIDRMTAWVRPPERNAPDTLFVGPAADCSAAILSPAFAARSDYRPIGFVDVQAPPTPGALGHIEDFSFLVAASGARVVVICGNLTDAHFQHVVDTALAGGCQVLSVPRSGEICGVHPTTVWRRGHPLVELTAPSLKGQQLVVKRAVDLVGALFGALLLTPLFAIVAVMIKVGSRGPVFFRQDRVGRGGRVFKITKFRTMVNDAETRRDELLSRSVYSDPRLFKVLSDPRMTRVGRWLRRTSLDELPQLINVLRGEMSLVGPRPPLPSEVALYEAHHYARFDVKPGITGPWQVGGRTELRDFERIVALETAYIREWSLLSDLRIIVKTIPAVVRMRGAH